MVLMKKSTASRKNHKTPFTLYRRSAYSSCGNPGIFYVQFKSADSKNYYTTAKSTGTTDETKAMMIAWQWYSSGNIPDRINKKESETHGMQLETVLAILRNNQLKPNELQQILATLKSVYKIEGGVVPNTSASIKVKDYFVKFWDPEKSEYLHEQKMSGKPVRNGHIQMMQQLVKNFWLPAFGEREIGSFTKKEIQAWLWKLQETKVTVSQKSNAPETLSHGYANRIVSAGVRALRYAYENKLITNDCFTGINYLQLNPKAREILTEEQATKLFHKKWAHDNSKLANQVAMLTGLRQGEIEALRLCDLEEDKIRIRHNFARHDGLKCPKNGHERTVPASHELIALLRKQAAGNPHHQGENGFIFWSTTNPDKPFDGKVWRMQLQEELRKDSVENYKNITFHAWRHFFSTYIEPQLTHSDLQKVTGHLTEKMLEHYADHETETALKNVNTAIEKILLPMSGLEEAKAV
jgi:integrase